MSIATDQKATLRKTLAQQYKSTDLKTYAQSAVAQLGSTALWRTCTNVLAYAPMHDEIPFLEPLMQLYPHKQWFLPKVHNQSMDFIHITNTDDLVRGAFDIPEPQGSTLWQGSIDTQTICIVPARALDAQGNRLGKGRGFYDRFLAQNDLYITTLSVVPDFAFVPTIPIEAHDKSIDFVYKACPNT